MKKTPLIIGRTPRQRAASILDLLRSKCWYFHVSIPPVVTQHMIAWIAGELEVAYNAGRIDQIGETIEDVKHMQVNQ